MHYPGDRLPLVRALQGETVQTEEVILRRNGHGKGIWISMSAEPIKAEDGTVNGAVVLVRNITYRKQIELNQEKQTGRTEALYRLSRSIAEAGTDLEEIVQLVVRFTTEEIGDLSLVTLLNSSGDKLRFAAFHDTNPTGQALLRKSLMADTYYNLQGIVGGVIKSGEPLLIPFDRTATVTPDRLARVWRGDR